MYNNYKEYKLKSPRIIIIRIMYRLRGLYIKKNICNVYKNHVIIIRNMNNNYKGLIIIRNMYNNDKEHNSYGGGIPLSVDYTANIPNEAG